MKSALLFPGYGSQFVGMGKELYDESRIMQEYFEEAANCLNINFVKLCFAASDIELGRMEHAYPALFLLGASVAALLKHEGIVPNLVAGYDTGQLAALHAIGGINFPDGLYLLSKYADFFKEFLTTIDVSAMRVHGVGVRALGDACRAASNGDSVIARIAAYDPYDGYLIAGQVRAVDHVREQLGHNKKAEIHDADIELGLHSELMEGVAANLRVYSEKVDFKSTDIPLIANAALIKDADLLKATVLNSITMPIMWESIIQHLESCDLVIQVGPGSRLLQHVMCKYPEKQCIAINKPEDIVKLKAIVGL